MAATLLTGSGAASRRSLARAWMLRRADTRLPASVRLALVGHGWLRGHVVADHLIDAVVDQDATHLVALPGHRLEPLVDRRSARCGRRGADALGAALPAEGDPVGLGGPAAFNAAALEAGEAVVVLDAAGSPPGWCPDRVGAAVTWRSWPPNAASCPTSARRTGRCARRCPRRRTRSPRSTSPRWRPEVADRLMNLRHRPRARGPARGADALRGARRAGPPGPGDRRPGPGGRRWRPDRPGRRRPGARRCAPLGRAARRALVAAASPEVWPPD